MSCCFMKSDRFSCSCCSLFHSSCICCCLSSKSFIFSLSDQSKSFLWMRSCSIFSISSCNLLASSDFSERRSIMSSDCWSAMLSKADSEGL